MPRPQARIREIRNMANNYDVAGRNAVVTGATRGIGRATAKLLAANGAKVVVQGREQQMCDDVAADMEGAVGIAADLSIEADRMDFCERIAEQFDGRVDILVHNAGVFPQASLENQPLDEWRYVMALNLESNFHITKLLLPCLKQPGAASIILVSSVVTKLGRGDSPAYTASKAGQIGLTRHLAAELGKHGIRVNAVLPGLVDTDGTRTVNTDERYREFAEDLQMVPIPIQSEDLAETIVFLSTPAARTITAACIDVNGGLRV